MFETIEIIEFLIGYTLLSSLPSCLIGIAHDSKVKDWFKDRLNIVGKIMVIAACLPTIVLFYMFNFLLHAAWWVYDKLLTKAGS